ncbi:UNKNOWN [Stylonychia lemnae]|uniref:Tyrosine-protein phosphatase domain-containing protein n=1 Tax=Stylonychia lemnae TaxID=5949 RepID=A0A078AFZ1_STYLE|nr:UNKNOWN [Stylonychia lemnae]|eukprot:CDW80771.1 UNKNOWN [Stylonychia lemnae]
MYMKTQQPLHTQQQLPNHNNFANHHHAPVPQDSFKVYNQQRQPPMNVPPQNQPFNIPQQQNHQHQQQQIIHQQQWSGAQQQLQNPTIGHQQQMHNNHGPANMSQHQQQHPQTIQLHQQQNQLNNPHQQINSFQQTPQQQQPIAQQQNFNNEEPDQGDIIGVIKIKDGIFICDEFGAQDLEFVVANKVTRVVNTAGMQLPNHWEPIGVLYLTLNWQDDEKQTLFDSQEKIPDEIYKFMEEAIDNQESVLVQSVKAQNRACFVIAAFIMRRYRWSLLKTLEFLNSRRPDLEMRPSFLSQLSQYENRLYQRGLGPKTQRWTELSDNNIHLENEELILRNTYLNSQMAPIADLTGINTDEDKSFTLKWVDENLHQKRPLAEEGPDDEDLVNKINPPPIMNHKEKRQVKSIVKGSRLNHTQKLMNQQQQQQQQTQQQQIHLTQQQVQQINSQPVLSVPKSKFLAKTSNTQQTPVVNIPNQQQPTGSQLNFNQDQENLMMINQPSNQSNFANYQAQINNMEPKKRELTQKIPQKTTLPNDDKSTINMSSMSSQLENIMNDNPPHHQTQQNPLQQAISGPQKITNLNTQQNPINQTLINQQALQQNKIRGISPSVQQKQNQNDTGSSAKKRPSSGNNQNQGQTQMGYSYQNQNQTSAQDMKRTTAQMNKYTPTSVNQGSSMTGLSHQQQRPGSVPKRPHTPTQNFTQNNTSTNQSSTSNSFILKNNQNNMIANNSSSNLAQKQNDQNAQNTSGIQQQSQPNTQSKNMLNSFRNGPIKIMNSNTTTGGGLNTNYSKNDSQTRPISSSGNANQMLASSSASKLGPNKSGQTRPSSAPAKRPSSPSQSNNMTNTSNTTQNRVKYNPSTNSNMTRSAVFKHGQQLMTGGSNGSNLSNTNGIQNNTNNNTAAAANGAKPGLNPTLRGYSPSKLRWKQQTGQNPPTQQQFGQSNPNTYTRSTKHIPSYKQ